MAKFMKNNHFFRTLSNSKVGSTQSKLVWTKPRATGWNGGIPNPQPRRPIILADGSRHKSTNSHTTQYLMNIEILCLLESIHSKPTCHSAKKFTSRKSQASEGELPLKTFVKVAPGNHDRRLRRCPEHQAAPPYLSLKAGLD